MRIGLGRIAADPAFSSPFAPSEAEKPRMWIEAPTGADGPATTKAARPEG